MRTETINVDGTVVTIGVRKVRTSVLEGMYTTLLYEQYNILPFMREMGGVKPPKQVKTKDPDNDNLTVVVADTEDNARYLFEVGRLAERFPLENQQVSRIVSFVAFAARIHEAKGAFSVVNGKFDKPNLIAAYENFLDSEEHVLGSEHEDTLWESILKAIKHIDAPIAPIEQRLTETLEVIEQNDPLSVKPTSDGKTTLLSATPPKPKGGRVGKDSTIPITT